MGFEVHHCSCICSLLKEKNKKIFRGLRAEAVQPATRNPRYTLTATITVRGVLHYTITPGSMNGLGLFYYLLFGLLPLCNPFPGPNSILIMDNCRFHHSWFIEAVCNFFGVIVLFLPPYSPHLNPIEVMFNCLKMKIKRAPWMAQMDIQLYAYYLMETECLNVNWHRVARQMGYGDHVAGL